MTWDRRPLHKRDGSPSRRINVCLTEADVDAIDAIAATNGKSRSETLRNIIRAASAA